MGKDESREEVISGHFLSNQVQTEVDLCSCPGVYAIEPGQESGFIIAEVTCYESNVCLLLIVLF